MKDVLPGKPVVVPLGKGLYCGACGSECLASERGRFRSRHPLRCQLFADARAKTRLEMRRLAEGVRSVEDE